MPVGIIKLLTVLPEEAKKVFYQNQRGGGWCQIAFSAKFLTAKRANYIPLGTLSESMCLVSWNLSDHLQSLKLQTVTLHKDNDDKCPFEDSKDARPKRPSYEATSKKKQINCSLIRATPSRYNTKLASCLKQRAAGEGVKAGWVIALFNDANSNQPFVPTEPDEDELVSTCV